MIEHLFFFNDTATTEIYTLSLHDALPISMEGAFAAHALTTVRSCSGRRPWLGADSRESCGEMLRTDRKSTRLNSSHANISYAVFCLKKKKNNTYTRHLKQII